MTKEALRPAEYRSCGQSLYTAIDPYDLLTTAEASIQWYRGIDNYSFASGRAKRGSVRKSAYQFTQMVWKGAKGKKVGFGVKDDKAVAWYCLTGNEPDVATDF